MLILKRAPRMTKNEHTCSPMIVLHHIGNIKMAANLGAGNFDGKNECKNQLNAR